MRKRRYTIDFETRSEANLKKVSPELYAAHPSTDILCMGFGFKVDCVGLWMPLWGGTFPSELRGHILAGGPVIFHGKSFDQYIYSEIAVKKYGAPPLKEEQIFCTQARCSIMTYPRSLGPVSELLKLTEKKDSEGHGVMLKASKPRKPTKNNPSTWFDTPYYIVRTGAYCVQDIKTQINLDLKVPDLSPYEHRVWRLDQAVNQRGFCVDIQTSKEILKRVSYLKIWERLSIRKFTKGEVWDENDRKGLLSYCESKGVPLDNTQYDYIEGVMKKAMPASVKRVLDFKQQYKRATLDKYKAIVRNAGPDNRVRNYLVYAGAARTGRWNGQRIQPLNMFRPEIGDQDLIEEIIFNIRNRSFKAVEKVLGSEMRVYASLLRSMFIAAEGHTLFCADFSGVELRILFWYVGDEKSLRKIKAGACLYREAATKIFRIELKSVNSWQRTVGKQQTLSLGYGMSENEFFERLEKDTRIPTLEREISDRAHRLYHRDHPLVRKFWDSIESKAKACIRTRALQILSTSYYKLIFRMERRDLTIQLPSGRKLRYCQAKLEGKWGNQITFFGAADQSRKWIKQRLWGSKMCGHIVQSTARDQQCTGLLALDAICVKKTNRKVYPLVLGVHDEAVNETRENEGDFEEYCAAMATIDPWLQGCPITVEGWQGKRYRKG